MRLTIRELDTNPLATTAVITLDGVEQRRCIVADEERGYVSVRREDENGRLVVDKNSPNSNHWKLAKCRRMFGVVKIHASKEAYRIYKLSLGAG